MPPDPFLILLVDDEPPVADILRRISQQDFPQATILSTSAPHQTLEYLANQANPRPHLILLDIDLHSVLDGVELLPIIRSMVDHQVPIILFTASERAVDKERSAKYGNVTYAQKPTTLANWREYIDLLKTYWHKTTQLPGTRL